MLTESPSDSHGHRSTKMPKKFLQSDAGDGTKASQQYLHGYRLVFTLASLVITLFIVALDQTIVLTLLTQVSSEFGSFTKVGWLTSGFMLPMACLAPSYGKVSIAFGRRNTLAAAIVIFEIGSLISALAQNMDMLIGGRVIQGIGGGAIQAMVIVILSESVPIHKRALAMALIGVTFSVASVCGPFIGGAFTTHVTWRWCFYVNLPIGGVALGMLLAAFHPPPPQGAIWEKLAKIDFVGTFLMVAGLVLVLLALTFGGNEFTWNSATVIVLFVVGGVVLLAFIGWNFLLSKEPLIEGKVVAVPQIVAGSLCACFSFMFFMGLLNYLAIYFQFIHNASAWQSGIDLLPFIITVSLSSTFNGVFMRYSHYIKIPMMISAIFGPLGVGLVLLLDRDSTIATQIGVLIPAGVSVGFQFQSTLLAAQVKAPGHIEGSMIMVTVFLNFCKSLGGVLGVVTSQVMLLARSRVYLGEDIKNSGNLSAYASVPSLLHSPELIWNLPQPLRNAPLDAVMKALKDVFYLNLAFAVMALFCALFTTNKKIPKKNQVQHSDDKPEEKEQTEEISSNSTV